MYDICLLLTAGKVRCMEKVICGLSFQISILNDVLEIQCINAGFRVYVYSRFTVKGSMGHGTRYKYRVQPDVR